MFVDSHIHLSHEQYNGTFPCIDSEMGKDRIIDLSREELIKKMREQRVGFCIEPAIGLKSNTELLKLASAYPEFIYPAVGIHPTRVFSMKWKDRKTIEELSVNKKVIAVGETGLDYHYDRKDQHRWKQLLWFWWQIQLAYSKKLPLILHIRKADKDAVKVLRYNKRKILGGVCHCFNGSMEYAKIYTEEFGFMLGIGGSLLQNECSELEKVIREISLEFLILETDGPFVKSAKPEKVSGNKWKKARNSSLIIPDVAKRISEIKGIDASEVERVTTENVKRLFNLY